MAALDVTLKDFVAGVEWAGAGETFTIDVMTILEKEDITVVAPAGTLFSVMLYVVGSGLCTGGEPLGPCEC